MWIILGSATWIILGSATPLLVVLVFWIRRQRGIGELGWVSREWIAQHRTGECRTRVARSAALAARHSAQQRVAAPPGVLLDTASNSIWFRPRWRAPADSEFGVFAIAA
jgi:hypothetical protein